MILVGLASILVQAAARIFIAYLVLYFVFASLLAGLGISAVLTGQPLLLAAVLLVLFWRNVTNRRRARTCR